jgi:hypothetical protein
MMIDKFPADIRDFLRPILERDYRVWLFGSRANETHKPDSDWDVLVFGDCKLLSEISNKGHPTDLDLFIVTNNNDFECPWPRSSDGVRKKGNLTDWEWKDSGDGKAVYKGTKWPDDWGKPKPALLVRI